MFKLESYITPLILSYVDKYVKNGKPEDSQVSLWGGDGVFNNLDLRLDVLEQELQLPFTFVNGHIHELRIHVPWTKLGSEPIIVTVNTFECILKLKDGSETENVEVESVASEDSTKSKKKPRRLEVVDAPPSYMQSLISRITNNINIICNNVILKYVEDDIVLSVNVKSAEVHCANDQWEIAYIDLNLPDLVVRKLIRLVDVTICLDQRSASGKIETYQEPLIYRSSIEGRLYLAYDSLTAKAPTVTRVDFKCDNMEISVTDHQLPMLLRLAQLCLALYFGDLVLIPPSVLTDKETTILFPSSEDMDEMSDEQSWGSWAWSLIPQFNYIWEDDGTTDEDGTGPRAPNPIVHFAAHLNKTSILFKLTETSSSSQKVTFTPLACINAEGLFIDAVLRHPDCANIQAGASGFHVVSVGDCVCDGKFSYSNHPEHTEPILLSLGQLGQNEMGYLDHSLFNETSPENRGQRRDYNYDWEDHFNELTEKKLIQRSPAGALDYFYFLVLPEDHADKSSSYSDLEDSNMKERLMARVVVGPCEVNLTGNFVHRLEKCLRCAFNRDFEPYSNSEEIVGRVEKHSTLTAEDAQLMEEFIPFKCYVLTMIQPTVRLFPSDHLSTDITASPFPHKKKKSKSPQNGARLVVPASVPVIHLQVNRVEMQQTVPMYPKRVVTLASSMCPVSDHFIYNSNSHITLKVFGIEVNLATMIGSQSQKEVNIIPPFSVMLYLKELQYPTLWKNPFQPKTELFFEMVRFTLHLTWPQVLLVGSILNSWYQPCIEKVKFLQTSLTDDVLSSKNEDSSIEFSITGVQCKYSMNDAVHSSIAWVSTMSLTLQHWSNEVGNTVTIFHGPEDKGDISSVNYFKTSPQSSVVDFVVDISDQCLKIVVQFPINMTVCSAPTVLLISVKGLSASVDPILYEWLNYFPSGVLEMILSPGRESPKKDDHADVQSKGSGPSSLPLTVPTESRTLSISQKAMQNFENGNFKIPDELVAFGLSFFNVLKRLSIEIQCDTCSIFLPTRSLSSTVKSSSIVKGMQKMFTTGAIPETLVINLPSVLLHNGTQKQNLHASIEDIPVYTLEGWNLGPDLFPWTLLLTNFSVYTLHPNKDVLYCIRPISSSATIAINSKYAADTADKLSQLSLCIHADNQSLHVELSDKQVQVIAQVVQLILDGISKLVSRGTSTATLLALSLLFADSGTTVASGNYEKSTASISQPELVSAAPENLLTIKEEGDVVKSTIEIPKLSLWLQWTLPKFTLDLCALDGIGTLLNLELEELVVSLDVQDVYSKVKLKLTAFNWNHYKQDQLGQFIPGPYKGIIFSCSDKLNRMVTIANPKAGATENLSLDLFETRTQSTKSSDKYNFVTVTLTRAQSKNVQRRWAQLLRENSDPLETKVINLHSLRQRYISEIDIKVKSFDCVLWCPVIVKGLQIFEPFFHLNFSITNSAFPLSKLSPIVEKEPEKYRFQMFNNNSLPLLYVGTSVVRFFVPKGLLESASDSGKESNMCIFQVESMSIVSQVDNSLSRVIIRPDIHSLAQQARILNIPGSEVEDRQYQMDVTGISITSGSWEELIKRSSVNATPSVGSQLHTMGENPALEWNNKKSKSFDNDDSELVFLPLMVPFNTRILVAPAIVYQQMNSLTKNQDEILVSGHSFEVNLTSDLDVYLSLNQMTLLYNICFENIATLLDLLETPLKERLMMSSKSEKLFTSETHEFRLDSGIESDVSTLKTIRSPDSPPLLGPPANIIIEQQIMSQSMNSQKTAEYVPFEILFTARNLTLLMYTDKPIKRESRIKDTKTKQGTIRKKRQRRHHSAANSSKASKNVESSYATSESLEKKSDSSLKGVEVNVSSLHDGYEGSVEDSLDDMADPLGTHEGNNSMIVPLLYFTFTQPHAFLRCQQSTSKLEASCFDISVKGTNDKIYVPVTESKILPAVEDYAVPWFETKPGDIDAKTGIPPALFTFSVMNFLSDSADVKLSLDRPLKVNLSLLKFEQILDYIQAVFEATIRTRGINFAPSFQSLDSLYKSQSAESWKLESVLDKVRHYLTFVRFFHFATVQVVFVLETVPHRENAHVVLSWGDINGTIKVVNGTEGLIDEISLGLSVENYAIKTSYNHHLRSLVEPLAVTISLDAIWESWNKLFPLPRICSSMEIEAVILYCGKEHDLCFDKLQSHLMEFIKAFEVDTSATDVPASTLKKIEKSLQHQSKSQTELQGQTWHDDLRVGTFQYIQDSDDTGLQPGPYEIVFCRGQAGQSASMTWCYPEPRVLTRVEIYPVPFRTATDVTSKKTRDHKEEVACVLQYWDPLVRSYMTCQHFQLSEIRHCNLTLPHVSPTDTKQQLFISPRWRVILDYYDPNDEAEEFVVRSNLVSPLALAACMRVDSYFNPNLIPIAQARVSFEVIHLNLSNHLQQSSLGVPMVLQPFNFDGTMPYDHDCLTIVIQNAALIGYSWQTWSKLELTSNWSANVLEYRSLTMRRLLEPCGMQGQLTYTTEEKVPPIMDLSIRCEPIVIHIAQSTIHTIYTAIAMWKQVHNPTPSKDRDLPLLNYYVICNDLQETLRFGQVDMDENIILQSRQMHAYSWRSHRTKQLLHVCVEGMRWKWCEPFSIDKVGDYSCTMQQDGNLVTLIIKVQKLSSLQKRVIICGQLVFTNRLNKNLDIKLAPVANVSDENHIGGEQCFALSQQATAATCISEPGGRREFFVRFSGNDSTWSEGILFPQKSLTLDNTLVKIPLKDGQYLNAWCHFFVQSIASTRQMLVMFSPLYIIQTHLPRPVNLVLTTPGLGQTHCVEVNGCGQEFQLHCPGGVDVTHQLAFQVGQGTETSQPSLPLSVNMITQVTKLPHPEKVNIEEITTSWVSGRSLYWPYDDKEYEKKLKKLPPGIKEIILKSQKPSRKPITVAIEQPNIDLEVCLVQRWPACNTLLIDVKPWGLIINKSSIDLILHTNEDQEWSIPNGETFASPKLKEYLRLGVTVDGETYYSEQLRLTDEDWSFRRYWPKMPGVLPECGVMQCDIKLQKGNHTLLTCLTLTTKVRHGIRIIQIQPTCCIVNNTDKVLEIATCTTPATDEKIEFTPNTALSIKLKSKSELGRNVMQPLLFWEAFQPEVIYYGNAEHHLKYVSFCDEGRGSSINEWSLACRIQTLSTSTRHSLTIPVAEEKAETPFDLPLVTIPYVLTAHEFDSISYLVFNEDRSAQLILNNHCNVPLNFGQGPRETDAEGFRISEEMELIYRLPILLPMTACHYTFPKVSTGFPNIREPQTLPKLHFCKATGDDEIYRSDWSNGIDVTCEGDLFLNIPDFGDAKIHVERVAHSTYIFVDSVSRVVSAKEIRGRIQSGEQMKTVAVGRTTRQKSSTDSAHLSSGDSSITELNQNSSITVQGSSKSDGSNLEAQQISPKIIQMDVQDGKSAECKQVKIQKNKSSPMPEENSKLNYCAGFFKQVCIVVVDETSKQNYVTEVMRVTFDNAFISSRPKIETLGKNKRIRRRVKSEMVICFENVQWDNQMSDDAAYDFPVILVRQHSPLSATAFDSGIPLEMLLQRVRSNAFFVVEWSKEKDPITKLYQHDRILVGMKPVALYIEDTFFYKLYEVIPSFRVNAITQSKWKNFAPRSGKIPVRVAAIAAVYRSPFQVETMIIEPLNLLLSVHASLKLYISLVETPLTFKQFEKSKLMTTSDRLGNAVMMHFVSGALVRAGWVVGSVDLIGNPGGFARAIGTGVADFVRMPYQGFLHGPWAFLMGMASGSSSLIRQISGGSLFSITNLASSVSRNMERLSLDEDYRHQNEESRRNKPECLTQGLVQGLSGFGISILGAIAGIVDQPLQSVQRAVEQQSFPPTAAVTGLVSGVSKGLVGIVAKPVGGAAELLAQAGQGILHSTGWSQILKPRFEAGPNLTQHAANSRVKYAWKMLADLPEVEVVCAIDATQFNQTGHYIPCVLLLTSQVLFLVSIDEDTQQQAFSLIELDCHGLSSDPTLLYLIPIQKPAPSYPHAQEPTQDRVVDFVSKSTKYAVLQGTDESESQSDTSSRLSPPPEQLATSMKFYVSPRLRNLFVALFATVKRNVVGKGFPF